MTGVPINARGSTGPLVWRFVAELVATLRWRLALAVGLAIVVAFTEGAGLVLLVPLLAGIGLAPSDGSSSRVATLTTKAFAAIGATPSLGAVLVVFVAVTLLYAVVTRAYALLSPTLAHRFATTLRRRLYGAIVSARWSYIAERRATDLAHAVTVEADRAGTAAYQFLSLLSGAAVSAAYLAVAARLSPGMTGIVIVAGVVLLVLFGGRTRTSEALAEVYSEASRRVFGMASQSLGGLKVAKSVGAEARDVELFTTLDRSLADAYYDLLRSFGNTRLRLDVVSAIGISTLLLLAVGFFHLSGTGLLLLVFVCARIIPRVRSLQESAQLMIAGLPAFRDIETTIAECERAAEPPNVGVERLALRSGLQVDRVSYRYATADRLALDGVTLSIPVGRTVAIVGASGSGKSTLADVLMGLMPPLSGSIVVDGVALDPETLHRWRRSIGYVPQDSFLLHDTIRANLLWAVPGASEPEMWDALERSAARAFVEAHPDGLDAIVGDRGLRLSGGERQRLALARALLARPAVLLLDEATSALDSINEQQILASLARLHGQLTIVVITHRLSTIRDADFVYVLDQGRLVESGEWGELAARAGPFNALLEAQRLETQPVRN